MVGGGGGDVVYCYIYMCVCMFITCTCDLGILTCISRGWSYDCFVLHCRMLDMSLPPCVQLKLLQGSTLVHLELMVRCKRKNILSSCTVVLWGHT